MSLKAILLDNLPAGKGKWVVVGLLSLLALVTTALRTAAVTWKDKVDVVVEDYPKHKTTSEAQARELAEIKEAVKRVDQRTYDLALKAGVKSDPPAKETK